MSAPILFLTHHAVYKIQDLLDRYPDHRLLVTVKDGGCKEYFYDIAFVHMQDIAQEAIRFDIKAKDGQNFSPHIKMNQDQTGEMSTKKGLVEVYTTPQSHVFLNFCVLDFSQTLTQESFEIISNPNAKSMCGCGVSFV